MTDAPMPPPPPSMPAGWYPQGDSLRYWDGNLWTDHFAPIPPQQPQYAPQSVPQQAPQQQMNAGPLMQFTSHISGKNAQVVIYNNRVEWNRAGGFGIGQAAAATMTLGASLATSAGRGSRNAGTEVIPIKNISSVTTKKDGLTNWAVSIITSGNTIDMRVSRAEAEQVKSLLLSLMLN